jgi:hypothetical protein
VAKTTITTTTPLENKDEGAAHSHAEADTHGNEDAAEHDHGTRSTATNTFADAAIPHRDLPGARVLLRSRCLACHRIGSAGNNHPGRSLTRVGARLDTRAIMRALTAPPAPMPSFRRWLSPTHLRQLAESSRS